MSLDALLRDDHDLGADPRAHIRQRRRDRHRAVREQRPRLRRPDQQRVAGLQRPARLDDRQPHGRGHVLRVGVAHRRLVRGEAGAAARAVGDDLVALVDEPSVPQLVQRPPDRLDVLRVAGSERALEVDPEADPLGHPLPAPDVVVVGLAAPLVERRDAEVLDLALGVEPELLLDLQLDRQPVAVPAGLARRVEAAHRLVAQVGVLERAQQDVVRAGVAVRRRRALREAEDRPALARGERAFERAGLAPALAGSVPPSPGSPGACRPAGARPPSPSPYSERRALSRPLVHSALALVRGDRDRAPPRSCRRHACRRRPAGRAPRSRRPARRGSPAAAGSPCCGSGPGPVRLLAREEVDARRARGRDLDVARLPPARARARPRGARTRSPCARAAAPCSRR